jgi:GT2 family glycosyltransferase
MGLTIATVVCAYNERRLLPGCLYSLRAQTRAPDDIVVVDDARRKHGKRWRRRCDRMSMWR